MTHDCAAHGNHHPKTADGWTNFAAVASGIASFASDSYWLASIYNTVAGCESEILGLGTHAVIFGGLMGTFSALGSTLAHRVLNTQHQHTGHGHGHGSSPKSAVNFPSPNNLHAS